MARSSSTARALTDLDEIRDWAEERRGRPARVRGTGGAGDVGMIRIDFPGYSGAESLEPINWDEWFDKFQERNLALLVQDETAGGQRSNFNKLVNRDTVERNQRSSANVRQRTGSTTKKWRSRTSPGSASHRATASKSARSRRNSAEAGRSRSSRRAQATKRTRATGKKASGRVSQSRSTSRSTRRKAA